ncbi:MAG: transporter [Conexibacter sp.]|nr:transporter [Conexibacter sp.]
MPAVAPHRLPRPLVALLAIATGASVANIYYVQPLLNEISRAFGVSDTAAGLLVSCAQIGYVAGIALLVPLGDVLERRGLISTVLVGTALACAACAAAPTFGVLAGALVAIGVLSVVAQIVVPLSASLAGPEERGQVVGTVMSGLLIGILIARTVSGLIAELGGWRLVFALAAGMMLLLSLVLRRALPHASPPDPMPYRSVLRSVFGLIRDEPVLRQRMTLGALHMMGFSILWTAVAFLLGHAPYHYGEGVIGLFGLVGVVGAGAAQIAGRGADRGHGRLMVTLFLTCLLVSWGLLALGGTSLVALIAGIALLDLGVQGAQISNQTAIYALRPEARSRLTTAYMVSVFLGGTLGSVLGSAIYGAAGWGVTCAVGAGVALTGLLLWGATQRVGRDGAAYAASAGGSARAT